MKGQTAMEYLMTYGWAILIIVVIGALLYSSGILNPQLTAATGFSKVIPGQFDVNAAGNLKVQIKNIAGEEINITNVYTKAGSNSQSTVLASGKTSPFLTITSGLGTGATGDAYTLDTSIEYYFTSAGSATRFNSTGTFSGKRS